MEDGPHRRRLLSMGANPDAPQDLSPTRRRIPSGRRSAPISKGPARRSSGPSANVQVAVRIRGLYEPGMRRVIDTIAPNTLRVDRGSGPGLNGSTMNAEPTASGASSELYAFDYVFGPRDDQSTVYRSMHPLIDGFKSGYNATVFAYGQSGSGKSYTMGTLPAAVDTGESMSKDMPEREINDGEVLDVTKHGELPRTTQHDAHCGIVQRAADDIMQMCGPEFAASGRSLQATFVELYNDEIRDLLRPGSAAGIREDRGHILWTGVCEVAVSSVDEVMKIVNEGNAMRQMGETALNATSSRSHAIFTLTLCQDGKPVNKMHFVDLAGSERLKRTSAVGDRAREGININSELLSLSNVISALHEAHGKSDAHIPYRDSKLTRVLQDSLGGNAISLMIACISDSDADLYETISTLKYAKRARRIRNDVERQREHGWDDVVHLQSLVVALRAKYAALLAAHTEAEQRASSADERVAAAESEAAGRAHDVEARARDVEQKASEVETRAVEVEKRALDAERRATNAEIRAANAERRIAEAEARASEATSRASEAKPTPSTDSFHTAPAERELRLCKSQIHTLTTRLEKTQAYVAQLEAKMPGQDDPVERLSRGGNGPASARLAKTQSFVSLQTSAPKKEPVRRHSIDAFSSPPRASHRNSNADTAPVLQTPDTASGQVQTPGATPVELQTPGLCRDTTQGSDEILETPLTMRDIKTTPLFGAKTPEEESVTRRKLAQVENENSFLRRQLADLLGQPAQAVATPSTGAMNSFWESSMPGVRTSSHDNASDHTESSLASEAAAPLRRLSLVDAPHNVPTAPSLLGNDSPVNSEQQALAIQGHGGLTTLDTAKTEPLPVTQPLHPDSALLADLIRANHVPETLRTSKSSAQLISTVDTEGFLRALSQADFQTSSPLTSASTSKFPDNPASSDLSSIHMSHVSSQMSRSSSTQDSSSLQSVDTSQSGPAPVTIAHPHTRAVLTLRNKIESLRIEHSRELSAAKKSFSQTIDRLRREHTRERNSANDESARARDEHAAELQRLTQEHSHKLADIRAGYEAEIVRIHKAHEQDVAALQNALNDAREQLERRILAAQHAPVRTDEIAALKSKLASTETRTSFLQQELIRAQAGARDARSDCDRLRLPLDNARGNQIPRPALHVNGIPADDASSLRSPVPSLLPAPQGPLPPTPDEHLETTALRHRLELCEADLKASTDLANTLEYALSNSEASLRKSRETIAILMRERDATMSSRKDIQSQSQSQSQPQDSKDKERIRNDLEARLNIAERFKRSKFACF